jgi:dienelactone hydrolase
MSARRIVWALTFVAVVAATAVVAMPYARSAAFVADLAGVDGWWRRLVPIRARPVATRDVVIPTRHGPIEGRLYEPDGAPLLSLLVYPGIHAGGVDEPRLVMFASRLAASGVRVLAVPLPDLRVYRIRTASTDAIEDTALWMSNDATLAPSGRVGLAGVSFAGGLALVAAGRPALRDRLAMVIVLGGHADLPRVMTYLCTGRLPSGTTRAPHDYGVVIVLLATLPRLVPRDQVQPLERAVLTFLDASSDAEIDPPRAATLVADATRQRDALPEPSRTLMTHVIGRDTAALGRQLLPFVEEVGGASDLSPGRSPATAAPVFLLHGLDDNVIPSEESVHAAQYLRSHNTEVRLLRTPLISHATLAKDLPIRDSWQLIAFWTGMWNKK